MTGRGEGGGWVDGWVGERVVVNATVGMLTTSPAYRSPHTPETEDSHDEIQNDGLGAGKTQLFFGRGPTWECMEL